MTPSGGVPFSLLACIPWEACMAHRFHRKIPKIAKKCPLFGHFFRKFPPPPSGGLGGSGAQKVWQSPPGWGLPHFWGPPGTQIP